MIGFIILLACIVWVISCIKEKSKNSESKSIILEIHKTRDLNEMIASIGFGRVYPYYIGMSLDEVKDSALLLYPMRNTIKLRGDLQSNERISHTPLISLPKTLNPYIDDIFLNFNENNVIDSIDIVIKDFSKNAPQLKKLMCDKFGAHTPTDGRYITWSDMRMVIRIDEIDGCIEVVYFKILGKF